MIEQNMWDQKYQNVEVNLSNFKIYCFEFVIRTIGKSIKLYKDFERWRGEWKQLMLKDENKNLKAILKKKFLLEIFWKEVVCFLPQGWKRVEGNLEISEVFKKKVWR